MKAKHDFTWIPLGEKLTGGYSQSLWTSLYVNIHTFAAGMLMCCVMECSPAPYRSCIKYSIWTISHFYNIQILNSEIYLPPSIWTRDCGTLSRSTLSRMKIEKTLHKLSENYLGFMKAYRKCKECKWWHTTSWEKQLW